MSIRKRGKDTYQISVYLGLDSATGKELRDTHTFHGTPKGAKAEERRLLRERDLGTYVSPTTLTVKEYLAQWLRDCAKPAVAATTYEGYARCVNRYIEPHIGYVALSKLRPLHVQSMYAALREKPKRGGGKLSGHTVLHAHRVLRMALKQAVRWQLVAVNVCDAVEPPVREYKEMRAITEAQTAMLLRGLAGTRYHAPVLVAVTCGLRRSELLALRWQDVDLKAGTLTVIQVVEQTAGTITIRSRPKTARSRRPVSIPPFVLAALKVHKAEQNARKLEQGNTYHDNDLVFPYEDGRIWSPSHFSRMYSYKARKLGIKCRLHDLRHSHASQLLKQGINAKIVSERLGHSTVAFTLDTYAHVMEGMDQDAARKIGTVLQAAIAKDAKDAR